MKHIEDNITNLYKKISGEFKITFISVWIFGLIAHAYMFTNKLPNYDDLLGVNGFGATFKVGRWFLWIIGAISHHLNLVFSLPWMNGLITLLTIAVSAGLIACLLGCKSKLANILIGAILVVFPSWTGTFFYMFTAHYYGIAVLMAVLSVYLTVRKKHGFVFGIILLACSMGIYQAYLPFTATLYVVLLITMLFEEKYTYLDIIKKSVFCLCNLIGGVVLYYVCMKMSLAITGQTLNDYKGLGTMGQFDLSRIDEIIHTIWTNYFCVFLNNNLEISYNLITKVMYLVLLCASIVMVGIMALWQIKKKNYLKLAETLILFFVYIIAINSIYIMCSDGVYSLMCYSYSFMVIFPIVLLDRILKIYDTNLVIGLEYVITCIIFIGVLNYCHFSNGQYLSIQLSYEQAKSYYTAMITQIKSAEGYHDTMKVAFKGERIADQTLYRNDVMAPFSMSGRDDALVDAYSSAYLLKYYCGFDAEYVSVDEMSMNTQKEINDMPTYPNDGSIKVIDGVVVVKIL